MKDLIMLLLPASWDCGVSSIVANSERFLDIASYPLLPLFNQMHCYAALILMVLAGTHHSSMLVGGNGPTTRGHYYNMICFVLIQGTNDFQAQADSTSGTTCSHSNKNTDKIAHPSVSKL